MKPIQKAAAVGVMCAFIGPNLCSIVQGKESFPFTPAPMFAHYIGDDTNFYDIDFVGTKGQTEKALYPGLNKNDAHARNYATMRFFLNKIYGSAEAKSPLGYFEQDTKAQFENRMSTFFTHYFATDLATGAAPVDTIRLEISRYNRRYKLQEKHVVGYYAVQAQKFTHVWKSN
ncbi:MULTISPECIES: hypothetical protein [Hymenobacter]|uniref:Uncharacterized protein n=1 Tax=Hymenobacter mucosus TaxID=1411120 RepID=A0A239ALW4_9BACT|nr:MULTISPECIES: hypothetical protein [Hymenobacter]SNR96312.1 hypothetical protein SAMN06269173_11370 [Hymenobacter mucosus]